MNKKTTIIIIIILAILTLAVFSYLFIFKKIEIEPPKGGSISSEADLQKQLSEVVKDKNLAKCDEIKDDFYKKVCINNVAVELAKENLDLSYCGKVDGQLISESYCNEQVLLLRFEKEETGDFCKDLKTTSEQEDCLTNFYNSLAQRKGDASACQNIADAKQADLCQDNYIVSKSFAQNPESFDCALLKSEDAKSDCENVKSTFSNGEPILPPGMNEKCLMLKTRIFTGYCL